MKSKLGTNEVKDRLLRQPQVLEILAIGKSTLWSGIKSGRYPAPIKISTRVSAWRESQIMKLIDNDI